MSARDVIDQRFPGALEEADYVGRLTEALHHVRCRADDTLVAVSVCRDELARSLVRRLEDEWGPVFDLSGLAGLPAGGASALAAALGHRPELDGRSRFVLVGLSHVGIDENGIVGRVRRPGMDRPSATCGSLAGAAEAVRRGTPRELTDDELDQEQIRVEQRVSAKGRELPQYLEDLAGLAGLALAAIEDDLEALTRRLAAGDGVAEEQQQSRPLAGMHGGLFTGVQIHRADEPDLVWPSRSVIDVGGDLRHDVI